MSSDSHDGGRSRWWTGLPLNRLFAAITAVVLVFLCIVIALGIRQYLLYHRCQQAVAASDRLLFQFTSIKGHLNESLVLGEEVNLRSLNSELQQLEKEADGLHRNLLVPEGLKPLLLSRVDLVNLEVRLRAVQERRQEKVREAAELVRALNTTNIGLQQFRLHLSDHTQMILLGLHKIIAGALGLIVALTCSLLFLLNRHLAAPMLRLCTLVAKTGETGKGGREACSLQELTERVETLLARGDAPPEGEVATRIRQEDIQRRAVCLRYAAIGSIGSEMTSEINNIINGVINYTQTLIDLDARGDTSPQREPLYQSLLKETKKIVDLSAAMQRLGQEPSSQQGSSLSSLFRTLSLVLDKPLRAESIVLVVPAECQGEVSVPDDDLWLVLLTLVQQGRRALKRVLPGRQQEKTLRIACAPDEPKGRRVTLTLVNSAACWDEESGVAAPAWPSQAFCEELLRLHGACLTLVATAEGSRLQLELPVRGVAV
ncbi:MAG: hypothetical protein RBT36_04050 [Desulfobulbus sp.]|nr:hypothetical protein [Desulfobulbus sp.]